MKYWWLLKYKNLEMKMLSSLFLDVQYFLVVPKNYMEIYQKLKNREVQLLTEPEMCILLYGISVTKTVKNNVLGKFIERLLLVPDTSLPISDYSLLEVIEEIRTLKIRRATINQIDFNNVAACDSCLNVFYVDQIQSVNQKGQCLCPFCLKNRLYFDNECIPMNYSFLFHSRLFYSISNLGCNYQKLQKLLKKSVKILEQYPTVNSKKFLFNLDFTKYLERFQTEKITSSDEPKLIKGFYDYFLEVEEHGGYEAILVFPWKENQNSFQISYLLILSCAFVLENFFYLKKIYLIVENTQLRTQLKKILKCFIEG